MKAMTTPLSSFQLAKMLRESLGEEKAESVVTYIDEKVKEEFDNKRDFFATKQDISDLKDKMDSHFKWLIGLFVGQMAFVLGIIYFILTYLKK